MLFLIAEAAKLMSIGDKVENETRYRLKGPDLAWQLHGMIQ